jgi:hypothetical protein
MNPEDLKKQADEETTDAGALPDDAGRSQVVKPDPDTEVVPPPCGDGCEGCPTCTPPEYEREEAPPETEQPPETPGEKLVRGLKEAKVKANEPVQEEEILQGLQIELTNTGEVKRNFYGTSQNVTLMLGLVKILGMEVEQRQRLQRGFMPSAEMTAMGGLARLMQNIGSVLVQVQGTMVTMNETMKAGFDETRQVESTVDAKSEQE